MERDEAVSQLPRRPPDRQLGNPLRPQPTRPASSRHQLAAADRDVTLLTLRLIAHTVRKVSHRIAYVGLERPDSRPDRLVPAGTYLIRGRHTCPLPQCDDSPSRPDHRRCP
jgi:hypothetical protein